jgi:hypothetical protein
MTDGEEDIQDKYEHNEYIHADESGVEVDKVYTKLPIVDIRMRVSSDLSGQDTVVEIYHRQKVSIRTDKQNGYVQDIYYYDHDEIPFQAVIDELKTSCMEVEKNTTGYTIETDED